MKARVTKIHHYTIDDKEVNLTPSDEAKFGREGYKKLRGNAKERDLDFEIPSVDALVKWWINAPDKCYWCNQTIREYLNLSERVIKKRTKNNLLIKLRRILITNNSKYLTFDRLDSCRGYSIDNLVKSCLICNITKGFIIEEAEYRLIATRVIGRINYYLEE